MPLSEATGARTGGAGRMVTGRGGYWTTYLAAKPRPTYAGGVVRRPMNPSIRPAAPPSARYE